MILGVYPIRKRLKKLKKLARSDDIILIKIQLMVSGIFKGTKAMSTKEG